MGAVGSVDKVIALPTSGPTMFESQNPHLNKQSNKQTSRAVSMKGSGSRSQRWFCQALAVQTSLDLAELSYLVKWIQ